MTMDVAAIGTVTATDAVGMSANAGSALTAEVFATVNLGAMIASRMSGTTGFGLSQAPSILRVHSGTAHIQGGASASSLDVPAALQAFGNGRIPKEMLTPIGIGQHRMWSVAAGAFTTMRAAAAADGVQMGVTDSYRTYDQQVELAARKGLWKDGGYAAVPGTSPHGWGLALDVDVDTAGVAWLRAHGARYGFVETTPREPWHWEYRGAT